MSTLITIIVIGICFSSLILPRLSARRSNMEARQARLERERIIKNRPLSRKRRNIDKGWDDYNFKDDYYKK